MSHQKINKFEYKVAMTCEGCSNQINRVLTKVKGIKGGVEDFDVDLESQKVTVTTISLSSEEISDILKKTGKMVDYIEK